MTDLHNLLVILHIAFGTVALLLFWIPAATRKGSRAHKLAGRFYVRVMMVVVISAAVSSIMILVDPIGIRHPGVEFTPEDFERRALNYRMFSLFLLMLAVLVFSTLRHGTESLKTRQNPNQLRKPANLAVTFMLGGLALPVGALGLMKGQILLIIFAGISLSAAWGMYRDSRVAKPDAKDRMRMHLDAMIASGIGAHTAFFAFGGARFLNEILTGQWQVIPWVLPAVIGTIAIRRMNKRYA